MTTRPERSDNWLVYDGDCPFCSSYVKLVKIRENVGVLRIINARDGGPEVAEVRRAGLDLDQGMVLQLAGQFYHGHDCIHAMAMLSGSNDLFNRFNGWVFRSKARSRALYPVLRFGRNLALRLLGRRRIRATPGI